MRSTIMIALALAGAGAGIFAAQLPEGSVSRTPAGAMRVATEKGTVEVAPVSGDIFRVTVLPADTSVKYAPSQSAILTPSAAGVRTVVLPDVAEMIGGATRVRVDRHTGAVSFLDLEGNLLLREAGGVDNESALKSVSLSAENVGWLAGGGEKGHSRKLNGDTLTLYNRATYGYGKGDGRISQMNITMPYLVSTSGYGILFDDYNKSEMQLAGDTLRYLSATPLPLSYYFVGSADKTLAGATANYSRLTGLQPLPPFWTLGYITSKYGYRTQEEAEAVVDSLLTRGYPLDGIVFDLYWYGTETDMGRLEWNPEQWPDHRKMLADFKEKGVNVVAITQPYINKIGAIDNYNELSAAGLLVKDSLGQTHDVHTWVGDAGMFDISNPATREWYWNRYRQLTEEGITGWWGDLGEPEVHPSTIVHANGQTADQYHNVYGNEWSRLVYEGLRKDFPDRRPMLLMRGGTSGLQRYSVFPWSGDVSRSWGGLAAQINIMLNSGLSGLGYMSSDIGGFAVDPKHPTDPELYMRWLQLGVFNPVLRTHAQNSPEPYHYPELESVIKDYIKMRYQWLPYNYSLAFENAIEGWPLVRPLNFKGGNTGDEYALCDDEYMWGDEVLVAPVVEAGARKREVLFPAGEWISWWNPAKRYVGGKSHMVEAPLEQIPLFVKAGSFIPQYEREIGNVGDYDPSVLTVVYYPSAEATSYTLYEDNRLDPQSIEKGEYVKIEFNGQSVGGVTTIGLQSEGGYKEMPTGRQLTLEVVGTQLPKIVEYNGLKLERAESLKLIRQYGWIWDASKRTVIVRLPYDYGKSQLIIK